jgi:ribosomal protein S18 acetylase RimI-like enzyme
VRPGRLTPPPAAVTETELYERGMRTAAACWAAFAGSTSGAAVHRLPHVFVAVFPNEPERSIYNNAILDRDLAPAERAAALEAMEELYAAAGVKRFAAWVHEDDHAMREQLLRRGYAVDTATRAMGMRLADVTRPRPALELAAADWREHLRLIGVAPDLLSGLDPATLQLVVARRGGENVGTGFGFDHEGDCGIYNVGTLEHARRQGVGSAVTSVLVHDAIGRGCRTASLQSTPTAERMYAAAGFRDLGRIIEYVPAQTSCGLTSR